MRNVQSKGEENMFSMRSVIIALVVLVGMASMGIFHTDRVYAHYEVDETFTSEAQFYGIPTFDTQEGPELDKAKLEDELEDMRRHFWGISVH
tara:strand:+ start:937 stop:1212 length:276 start_codon:yes stop_codon:yes gene_type:complete